MNSDQKELLKTQAAELTNLPEGWIADSQVIVDFDKQNKIRKHRSGYVAWVKRQGAETAEEGYWSQISNFTLECVSLERFIDKEDKLDEVQRRIAIVDASGKRMVTTIEAEHMNTLSVFVKWIEGRGQLWFVGNQQQLLAIKAQDVLRSGMRETSVKHISGHDPSADIWVFENAVVSGGKIYSASPDSGLIVVPKQGEFTERVYKLACTDSGTSGRSRLPKLRLDQKLADPQDYLRQFIQHACEAWGPDVEMVIAWFIAALFRHRCIYDEQLQAFPILMVSSPPMAGKTTLVKLLMRLFGLDNYKPTALYQLTQTSVFTIPNRKIDIPEWFDEFKQALMKEKQWLQDALKNNWDAGQRTVGDIDVYKTKTRAMRTGLVLTGETRSTDTALDSRCVDVSLVNKGRPDLVKKLNQMIVPMSVMLQEILKQYDAYWTVFRDRLDVVVGIMSSSVKHGVDSRAMLNYGIPCAALDMYIPDGTRVDRFTGWLTGKVDRSDQTNLLGQMLTEFPYMIHVKRLNIPYRIDRKARRLNVQSAFLIQCYQDNHRGAEMQRDELIRRGRESGLLLSIHKDDGELPRAQVDVYDPASGATVPKQQRAFVFDMNHPIVMGAVESLERGEDK